jgi:hypothetical protein
MERLAIALLAAAFGFLTGVLAWFVTPRVFGISYATFAVVSIVLAVVFFAVAIVNPGRASSWLGKTWDGITLLNREVLSWIKLIK